MNVDEYMAELKGAGDRPTAPRLVQSLDGTRAPETRLRSYIEQKADVDGLFGNLPTYHAIKREKPEHRIMLWLKLQCHSNREIAQLTGYSETTISHITRQPWFLEAFTKLSTEMGKDAVETMLEGEVLPSVQRLVALRDGAESDSVKLSAANSILDRIRGKPVQKTETKLSGAVDINNIDVAALLEEQKRNEQILKSKGIGVN